MKYKQMKLLVGIASMLAYVGTTMAQNVGQWDFDAGNLTQTAGATLGDLSYYDGPTGQTVSNTVFGTTAALGIPSPSDGVANVMGFPAGTLANGIGYLMPTPPPNGGGSLVNDYTFICDVLYTNGGTFRPLAQMDDGTLDNIKALFVINPQGVLEITNTSGASLPSGAYGSLAPNTWYRLGLVLDTDNGLASVYTNGEVAGVLNFGTGNIDSPYGLLAYDYQPVFSSNLTNSPGFVNSLQIRDQVLNPGQMEALGGPTAAGIPITLPPGHSFIASRSPDFGSVGVGPEPTIQAVIDQGAATITQSTIALLIDGSMVQASVAPGNPNQFNVIYSETNIILAPLSTHTVQVVYTDSIQGTKTNTWSFTVAGYQNITLPPPIYFEDFDEVPEGVTGTDPGGTWNLPTGWSVTNNTAIQTLGYDLTDGTSDAWLNWVVVNTNRLEQIASGEDGTFSSPVDGANYTPVFGPETGPRRLVHPPIVLNGVLLDALAHGNCIDADSDQRCNACGTPPQPSNLGQVNVLFTRDYDLTGYTNVYVKWNSLYEQNQDNIGSVEYSVDQGVTWLPVLYLLDNGQTDSDGSDVVTNNETGQIDVFATFGTPRSDQAQGLAYSNFIGAVVSTNLIPYIEGRAQDDPLNSKRIEVHRIPMADNCPHVRFRFGQAGTSSWYFGMDDFGLYSISLPVISSQPQTQTVDANTTTTFSVTASGGVLNYQWQFNGNNIAGATNSTYLIVSTSPTNAGIYTVVVSNPSGPVTSSPAQLTVLTVPRITSDISGEILDPGTSLTFSPQATGGQPLKYFLYLNGNLVGTSTSGTFTINDVQAASTGNYQLVVNNSYGAVTGVVAVVRIYSGPITSNLVVHLPFDGNFNDTSGRGNNATYQYNGEAANSSPTFLPGKLGSAFQVTTLIDSSDYEYATLGYPDDLQFGDTNDFSVSFWVNYTNQGDDIPFISNKDWDSSSNPGWGIFSQSGGNYRINVTGPNLGEDKYSETDTPKTLKDGNWHHVAVSIQRAPYGSSAYVYGYLDGVLVSKHPMSTVGTIDTEQLPFTDHQTDVPVPTVIQSQFQINIGQDGTGVYTDNHSGHLVGLLDDFGIWRRALTAHEVLGIYSAGLAGKDLSQAIAPSTLIIGIVGGKAEISWAGNPTVQLQMATRLNPPNWTDVPGTLGASGAVVPITNSAAFFRLSQ